MATTTSTNGSAKTVPPSKDVPETVVPEDLNGAADDLEEGEESDEYDFEEEQQAVEGEDDEYVIEGEEDDEGDDDYEDEGEGGLNDGAATRNGPQKHTSLTALLLGDPNAEEDDEEDYEEGDEDDEEGDYDDEAEGEDGMEESTPITPTSKKRPIDEVKEDDGTPEPEEKGAKKAKA